MSPQETSMGGGGRRFPSTRWSLIRSAAGPDSPGSREALEELCRLYWRPVYAYLRAVRNTDREDAKDLVQEFFLEILEGGLLARASAELGSFRSYLRGALRLFLLKRSERAGALKRGGGRPPIPLDAADLSLLDDVIDRQSSLPEEAFDREWASQVLRLALGDVRERLHQDGKASYFQLFDRHELNPPPGDPPSHRQLAGEYSISEVDVNNRLAHCRRLLRVCVAERIRDYAESGSEAAREIVRLFPG